LIDNCSGAPDNCKADKESEMAHDVEAVEASVVAAPGGGVADRQAEAGGHGMPEGSASQRDDVGTSSDISKLGKQRGGRRKKGTVAAATAEQPTPKKRGRRKAGASDPAAEQGAAPLRGTRAATSSNTASETLADPAVADEFEELLQLEQENHRLRQLLAAKLRDENAELRKRLGVR
jgi:hypothetical protein